MTEHSTEDHRTTQQLTALLYEVVDAARAGDGEQVKVLLAPLFLEDEFCCLYAFTGGLLEITKRAMPGVNPDRIQLIATPTTRPEVLLWGSLLVEHLRGHEDCVLSLFQEGLADGSVGAALAVGVAAYAKAQLRRRAAVARLQ